MPIALISGFARRVFIAAAGMFVLILAGCASNGNSVAMMQRDLTARQPEQALQRLQKSSVRNTDKVLYLLNEGMLLYLAGRWQDSNAAFAWARQRTEELIDSMR